MKPPNQHLRINLTELKAQIVKKLGPEGSKQYLYYLHRFLSLKMSKAEFDKLCLRILGRENIPLHNQLIRSILRNACSAKAPPPLSHRDDALKHSSGKEVSADGYLPNGSHTGLPNGGDMLPVSPRKARTGSRDRRGGDRRSALAPNGKTSHAPQLATVTQSGDFSVVLENGNLNPPQIVGPLQHHQEIIVHNASTEKVDLAFGNVGTEDFSRSPLRAPLGVPFCPVSIGGPRRALLAPSTDRCISASNDGALLDSLALRERMEQIAIAEGLEGVSVDCANILNHGLDSYIKGLIRSCIELVGARSRRELIRNDTNTNQSQMKLINGFRPGYQHQTKNSGKSMDVQEHRIGGQNPISLQDFRVAMELNPRLLGEDWPLLLEKICTQAFEE